MEIRSFEEIRAGNPGLADAIFQAISIRQKACSSASKFQVGAVVVVNHYPNVPSGTRLRFPGCNVENGMLEVTHAEQAAIAAMISALGSNPKPEISAVVVACAVERETQHALPCGFCRQWIAEFGTPATRIYGVRLEPDGGTVSGVECSTIGELLPYPFTL